MTWFQVRIYCWDYFKNGNISSGNNEIDQNNSWLFANPYVFCHFNSNQKRETLFSSHGMNSCVIMIIVWFEHRGIFLFP